MKKSIIKSLAGLLLVSSILQTAACGTLMYPERRGQKSGEIDIKVAVLDGLGLLFGIIPGVIAYAVDYGTGAIYLPPGKRNTVRLEQGGVAVIHASPAELRNPERIREIVAREMELPAVVDWSRLETARIIPEQVAERLVTAQATGYAR